MEEEHDGQREHYEYDNGGYKSLKVFCTIVYICFRSAVHPNKKKWKFVCVWIVWVMGFQNHDVVHAVYFTQNI